MSTPLHPHICNILTMYERAKDLQFLGTFDGCDLWYEPRYRNDKVNYFEFFAVWGTTDEDYEAFDYDDIDWHDAVNDKPNLLEYAKSIHLLLP